MSHRLTREQPPDRALLQRCSGALREQATRLDATYRMQMEAVSRARKEEAALLATVLEVVRPALPALVRPLLLLDVGARGRPRLLHLRALLVFGSIPRIHSANGPGECLLLLEDTSFLRVHFTGAAQPAGAGRRAFLARRLEGVDGPRVLRDHDVDEVTSVLLAAACTEAARRRAEVRDTGAYIARLQAVRVLLAR